MADALARDLADAQQISRTLQNKVIRLERERDDALKRLEGEQATSYALYQDLLKLQHLLRKVTLAVADDESNLFDVVTVDVPVVVWKQILAALEGR